MKCEDCAEYASEFCRDCLKEQRQKAEEEVVANTTAGVAFPPTAKFKLKRRKEPRVQQIIVQDRRYKVEKHGKPILRKSFAQYMKDKDNG